MRAVVKTSLGRGNVELLDIPEPTLAPGHVIVEVGAAGICGTDLHIQAGEFPCTPPVVLGHEVAGIVSRVAPDVTQWRAGQRVTCMPFFSTCGVCPECRAGLPNLCPGRRSLGSKANGTFAEYVVAPSQALRPLPANVDIVGGALCEPLACASHAVLELATPRPLDLVVVMGPGIMGILAARLAVLCGAEVVLVGTAADLERLAIGRSLGVKATVDVDQSSVSDVVAGLTHGRGADMVIECSGAPSALRSSYALLRRQGLLLQVGLFGRNVEIEPDAAVFKEIQIRHSIASTPKSWDLALKLIEQGHVEPRPLVAETLPLEAWEEGFEGTRRGRGVKYVLCP